MPTPEENYLFNMNLLNQHLETLEGEAKDKFKETIKRFEEMEVRRLKSDEEFRSMFGFEPTYPE